MAIDPNNLSTTATLTFSDEFNTLNLWNGSSGTWYTNYYFGQDIATFPSNGELQWYVNANNANTAAVDPWTVSNGVLSLTAARADPSIKPHINNYDYTSGVITSQFSFSQTYGYFEINAKLPSGAGLWPAFWLLPSASGAWRPEIDVMEVLGSDTTSLWQFSHPADTGYDRSFNTTVPDMSAGFHRYGVDWQPDKITFYFDGRVTGVAPTAPEMNGPMYMILNLAVGGSWGGPPTASTAFPASYQIDYVRVYQPSTAPTFTNLALSGPTSGAEGSSGATAFTYTVTRTGNLAGASTVAWAVTGSSGSPANASDFTGGALPGGSLSFAANQATATFTVNVAGDSVVEPDEGFAITLSNATGGTITGATATTSILNDDSSGTTLAIGPGSISQLEGSAGGITYFVYTVQRTGNLNGPTVATFTVSGSGANPASGSDFSGGSFTTGQIFFGGGEAAKSIWVAVTGDSAGEADETFAITLSNPSGAAIGTAAAQGTIRNDDGVQGATLAIGPASVSQAEGNSGATAFTFTVTRSGELSAATSASWAVTGSGANAATAADFTGGALPSGVVNFAAGQSSATVTVNVAGDTTTESNEAFAVTLSNPSGGTISTAAAQGVIQNDDAVQGATLAIGPASVSHPEGNSASTAFAFTVTRAGDLSGPASASWAATGSGASAATAADFPGGVLPSGVVNFAAGQNSATITVNVAGDTAAESNESFSVTLSNATGATITTAAAQGVIQNDDAPPSGTSLSLSPASAAQINEGSGGDPYFVFNIDRTGSLSGPTVIDWVVTGSGIHPVDNADLIGGLPTGRSWFGAGEAQKQIWLQVRGDTIVESDETFTIQLYNPSGATILAGTSMGTILNDDGVTVN